MSPVRSPCGLAALAALAALSAGCSSPAASPAPTTAAARPPAPRPPPRCAWYSPTVTGGTPDGQQVIVSATGPACRSPALIAWIAAETGKPWASTTLTGGTAIARLSRAGTAVTIWQTGFAAQTEDTAGYLADAFAAAGWAVQPPPAGGPGPPAGQPSPVGSAGIATIPASARST